MDFKEVKTRLDGYVAYCNLMLGTNLLFKRNKKFNQFEIIKKTKKYDIGKIIMTIETGYIRSKLTIRCYNINEYYGELIELYPELVIKFNEAVFIIYNDKELFKLLQNLESVGFFGNVRIL